MIDFKNGSLFKLSPTKPGTHAATLSPIMTAGETIIAEYTSVRDFVVFTNKRIIAVNVQGVTGKKKDFTTLPYSRIQAFSIETAGVLDLDAELDIYFSGLGKVRFEFKGRSNIGEIGRMISEKIL